jgi:4-hydroxy-3-methylbut-2-en-1-yl diphosphate synthase IspG/GcpE
MLTTPPLARTNVICKAMDPKYGKLFSPCCMVNTQTRLVACPTCDGQGVISPEVVADTTLATDDVDDAPSKVAALSPIVTNPQETAVVPTGVPASTSPTSITIGIPPQLVNSGM